ncbi:hypothetical protein BMR02_13105 [Methylococcaceae bacterium HT1]|uniref:hypothetical protein n=1 Tax=Bathymodiolus platifrons methanotrophic gill symbiont TaxID=113268 RepID=UPI000B415BB9|nr:hypothetical protein [Bathymodiolus platifrons methanotrophic gill symbiont]TXK95121.1 hypothetical protein BMR11_14155 [Methylococcaceae bacterium CS5]TXK95149.1 hypothetical protein BMR02_13105 [Methylococcaceae bacterium HT1]TXK95869.1 hypothetical protein BMR10_09235 [Methylococcaceae bacterium CS4]TXL04246.1 hypothetical protein BMR07_12905 [Methylococcaceae bacterium CS1]TXL09427.1 hypothetical protein BMR08_13390 [Methylococcaceae bacterium CS2]TXL17240.1 hypothetical protein BMR06_
MNQLTKQALLLMLIVTFSTSLYAKEITARASLPYKSYNSDTREKGLAKARISAWKKYVGGFSVARKSTYRSNKEEILRNLEDLIMEEIVVQEKNDKEAKNYKVSLRVSFDDGSVTALFNDLSASGNQGLGMASDFGSVLIARVKISSKGYDKKRVDVKESEGLNSVSEQAASNGNKTVDSVGSKTFSRRASGGSTTRKRTASTWEIDESYQETLSGAIEESLINAGFEPMEYNDLSDYGAPYMDEIYDQATDKGVLKGRTKSAIKNAARDAEWSYLGMGRVDLDLPITDAATGLFKVAASVNYQVYMFQNGKSRAIAKVSAKQVYGLGETEDYATNEALNKSALAAVTIVVDQLQKKGVR